MNQLITFSGAAYDETTRLITDRGRSFGADHITVYDDRWLMSHDFYQRNPWLWNHPQKRGFGWYAWKPFVIIDALDRLSNGDTVMYIDADTVPIASFKCLFHECDKTDTGIFLFASEGHLQYEWCKRDCFVVMGQDHEKYYNVQAGVARFMLFQKGSWVAQQFLAEWLTYAVNPFANTFDPSILRPELPGFVEHRAEQAIMTNLAHRYGVPLHREACGAGNGSERDRELYGQLFEQINDDTRHITSVTDGSAFANA